MLNTLWNLFHNNQKLQKSKPVTIKITHFHKDKPNYHYENLTNKYYINTTNINSKSDKENVHNTIVQDSIKAYYQRLQSLTGSNNWSTVYLLDKIKSRLDNNFRTSISKLKYRKINKVLKTIQDSNAYIHNISVDEIQVLNLTWQRLLQLNSSIIFQMFYEQLAQCISIEDSVVCPQGRIAQIIQTFELLDPKFKDLHIVPDWILKDEIGGLLCKYRQKIIDSIPSDLRARYINGLTNQAYDNKVKYVIIKNVWRKIEQHYIKCNLISNDKLQRVFDEMVEYGL